MLVAAKEFVKYDPQIPEGQAYEDMVRSLRKNDIINVNVARQAIKRNRVIPGVEFENEDAAAYKYLMLDKQ